MTSVEMVSKTCGLHELKELSNFWDCWSRMMCDTLSELGGTLVYLHSSQLIVHASAQSKQNLPLILRSLCNIHDQN